MDLKRLFGAEHGWTAVLGEVLLLGLGGFFLYVSIADLKEAARWDPVTRRCSEWLADPTGPRWVTLVDCQLDIAEAASRRWKGWLPLGDGGVTGQRYLELFVPLTSAEFAPKGMSAVLATSDSALLSLMDGIDAVAPEAVPQYLEAHAAEFDAVLRPKEITGYVEPLKSMAARTALKTLELEKAVILEQGKRPPRANALFGLVLGLIVVAVGIRGVARRVAASS